MSLGWGELLVILAIVLLIVGGKRLPGVGRALGEALREFRRATRHSHDDDDHHTQPPKE